MSRKSRDENAIGCLVFVSLCAGIFFVGYVHYLDVFQSRKKSSTPQSPTRFDGWHFLSRRIDASELIASADINDLEVKDSMEDLLTEFYDPQGPDAEQNMNTLVVDAIRTLASSKQLRAMYHARIAAKERQAGNVWYFQTHATQQPPVGSAMTGEDWLALSDGEQRNAIEAAIGSRDYIETLWIQEELKDVYNAANQSAPILRSQQFDEIARRIAAKQTSIQEQLTHGLKDIPLDDFERCRITYRRILQDARAAGQFLPVANQLNQSVGTRIQSDALDQAYRDIGVEP